MPVNGDNQKNKGYITVVKKEFPKGTFILFISFLLLLLVAYLKVPTKNSIPQDLIAVLRPIATPLQPFTLVDQNKQAFTKDRLNGKWSFVFFGYTYCPDICPTTLHSLKNINKALMKDPDTASDMQVIFVSVDPERDTPEILKKYTAYFNKEFIAVTGLADNILKFSKQFAAAYIKEPKKKSGEYLVSHTSSIFLVDPQMRIVASFSPPHYTDTITSQYLKIHKMFK